MPEDLWTEVHDIVQETVIKTFPKGWGKGGRMQKGKMVVRRGLTNRCEKEEKQKAKEKRKDIPI